MKNKTTQKLRRNTDSHFPLPRTPIDDFHKTMETEVKNSQRDNLLSMTLWNTRQTRLWLTEHRKSGL